MKKYKWTIVLINLLLLLGLFNHSMWKKETLLTNGKLALLELAPKDPRSLMQGDYMTLNYDISRNLERGSTPKRSFCVVKLTKYDIAESIRIQAGKTPLNAGEYLIVYTLTDRGRLNIGAESFFFQEGDAKKYNKAKYGGLRIDQEGNSLLVGLYDENRKKLE